MARLPCDLPLFSAAMAIAIFANAVLPAFSGWAVISRAGGERRGHRRLPPRVFRRHSHGAAGMLTLALMEHGGWRVAGGLVCCGLPCGGMSLAVRNGFYAMRTRR